MRKLRFYTAILGCFGVLLLSLVACQPTEKTSPDPMDPVITFNYEEVAVSKDGGSYAVEYFIENPVEGAVVEVTLDANWLQNLDTSIAGIIIFEALPNEVTEPRETTLTLTYSALENSVRLPVKQEAADPPTFVYSNLLVRESYYQFDLTTQDKEQAYILFTSNLSYMENNGYMEDDAALFADDIAYFQQLAESYHIALNDLLEMLVLRGDQEDFLVDGLGPKMNYVTYAYYIDVEKQELCSDIYRLPVSTVEPDQVDVDFEFEFNVQGSIVEWSIDPGSYDGYYFWNGIIVHDFYLEYGEDADIHSFARTNWNNIVTIYKGQYGMTLEEILEMFCAQGPSTEVLKSLVGETEYAFYALAVDEVSGYAASQATVEMVTTGAVASSDLELDFEVTNIKDRTATITCYPSNNHDTYAATYVEKERWLSYGNTDAERFDYIFTWYYMSELMGQQTIYPEGLYPDTDYVVFGFGYQGGTNTTRIFKEEFRTLEATYSGTVMSVSWDQYYDIPECYALDSDRFSMYYDFDGYAFVPMFINIEPESDQFYYAAFIMSEGEEFSENELMSELIYCQETERVKIYIFPYEFNILFAGFAADQNGEFGPLCTEEFVLHKEDTRDPQELIDLIDELYGAPAALPKVRSNAQNVQNAPVRSSTSAVKNGSVSDVRGCGYFDKNITKNQKIFWQSRLNDLHL